MMIPGGKYQASVSAVLRRGRPSISSAARAAAGGLIAAILLKSSSTKGRYRTLRRISRNKGWGTVVQQSARHA